MHKAIPFIILAMLIGAGLVCSAVVVKLIIQMAEVLA
uniref:Uncharacterized protein n=1 Tax=Salmonella phage PMBT35 TaxID=3137287 RepID=A0AAU8BV77_9VIRU